MEVEQEKPKSGINKTAVLAAVVAILVALILGLAILGYGYMNISHKNKVFEAEQKDKLQDRMIDIRRK